MCSIIASIDPIPSAVPSKLNFAVEKDSDTKPLKIPDWNDQSEIGQVLTNYEKKGEVQFRKTEYLKQEGLFLDKIALNPST